MTHFVLVPGAGGQAWYWSRLVPELERRGHTATAVDLPATDESAGLAEYADTIVAAVPETAREIVMVASSMGAYSASMVTDRLPVRQFVLLNAMTPLPGESPGDWWAATGQEEAARAMAVREGRDPDGPFDPVAVFLHDTPPDVLEESRTNPPPEQAGAPFAKPWPLAAWPDVPTRFLAGRADRLFPLEFQRALVAKRLGIEVEELPGGHLLALSQPVALAEHLVGAAG